MFNNSTFLLLDLNTLSEISPHKLVLVKTGISQVLDVGWLNGYIPPNESIGAFNHITM